MFPRHCATVFRSCNFQSLIFRSCAFDCLSHSMLVFRLFNKLIKFKQNVAYDWRREIRGWWTVVERLTEAVRAAGTWCLHCWRRWRMSCNSATSSTSCFTTWVTCDMRSPTAQRSRFILQKFLWPVILTFELSLDSAKMNQRVKYLGQRSFSSKVIWQHYSDWVQRSRSQFKVQGHKRKMLLKWSRRPRVRWRLSSYVCTSSTF